MKDLHQNSRRRFEAGPESSARSARWPAAQAGQSLVLLALAFVGILAFVGLAIDASVLFVNRVWMGKVLDAAALAGAYELPNGKGACARAVEYMENNGYDAGGPSGFTYQLTYPDGTPYTVDSATVPNPADCASVAIPNDHVQIRVTGDRDIPTSFLRLIGWNTLPVVVSATAEMGLVKDVVFVFPLTTAMKDDYCLVNTGSITVSLEGEPNYACSNRYQLSQVQVLYSYNFNSFNPGPDWADWTEEPGTPPFNYVSADTGRSGAAGDYAVKLGTLHDAGANDPRIVHAGFNPTAIQGDLFVTFWAKAPTTEVLDSISIRYCGRPGQCNTPANSAAWRYWGNIVQVWSPSAGSGTCYGPIGQETSYGWASGPGPFSGEQINCNNPPSYAGTLLLPHGVPGGITNWIYIVVQLPPQAKTQNPLYIAVSPSFQYRTGMQAADEILIDDLQIIAAPPKLGPWYYYGALRDSFAFGCWSPGNPTYYNCETEISEPGGGQYPMLDNLFPNRMLLQQPVYSVLLAIAGDDPWPYGAYSESFLNQVDPCKKTSPPPNCEDRRTRRVGLATFKYGTSYSDPGMFPRHALTTDYAAFRYTLFEQETPAVTAVMKQYGWGNFASYTGGIHAALDIIQTATPRAQNPAIILISNYPWDTSCSYDPGNNTCSPVYCTTSVPPPPGYVSWGTCQQQLNLQIQRAQEMGVKIFSMGLGTRDDFSTPAGLYYMEHLAQQTGGLFYYVDSIDDMRIALEEIAELTYVRLID